MSQVLDVQQLRLLSEPENAAIDLVLECDLLITGGGMGGCAAALAACRSGRRVVLSEETDWLGGQMTSQGVSALDEHRHIETVPPTPSYGELRALIRDYYRENTLLLEPGPESGPQSRPESGTRWGAPKPEVNPGNGWVSSLCFEPVAGLWALDRLLGPYRESGQLTLLLRHRAVSAEVAEDTVRSVTFRYLDGSEHTQVLASFVLDATELGDLLPLTGTEYVSGAEARRETGEPHALETAAPGHVQSFTYPFALEYRPGERHSVRKPEGYEQNRERQPYTLRHKYYDARGWMTYRMFEPGETGVPPFWTYRRLIDAAQFADPRRPHDVAMINWPGNDYRHGSLIDVSPETALAALQQAKALSLGFCYWLENECPRDEGGTGYPEFLLRPDVMGTADGLSRYPYIRESRRIHSLQPVVEMDIAANPASDGVARARLFPDSVGIGLYAIDIHPAEGEEKIPPSAARPFQIPLAALVPIRIRNLLPACKNIGTTHLTNGAYRLHPSEWAIGEAAARIAIFCLDRKLTPQTLAGDQRRLRRLQRRLVRAGVPVHWYVDLPFGHPAFEPAQMLAAWGVWTGDDRSLEFGPDAKLTGGDLGALTRMAGWARERLEPRLAAWLPRWSTFTRQDIAEAIYALLSV